MERDEIGNWKVEIGKNGNVNGSLTQSRQAAKTGTAEKE